MSSKTKIYLIGFTVILLGLGSLFMFVIDIVSGETSGRTYHIMRASSPVAFYFDVTLKLLISVICLGSGVNVLRKYK